MTTPLRPRKADDIIGDLDQAIRGLADLDTRELIFELIENLRSSYRLAMAPHLTHAAAATAIETEITDYIANNYGED